MFFVYPRYNIDTNTTMLIAIITFNRLNNLLPISYFSVARQRCCIHRNTNSSACLYHHHRRRCLSTETTRKWRVVLRRSVVAAAAAASVATLSADYRRRSGFPSDRCWDSLAQFASPPASLACSPLKWSLLFSKRNTIH